MLNAVTDTVKLVKSGTARNQNFLVINFAFAKLNTKFTEI